MAITPELQQLFLKTYNAIKSNGYKFKDKSVTGVDIGYRYDDQGARTENLTVRVHTSDHIENIAQGLSLTPCTISMIYGGYKLLNSGIQNVTDPARVAVRDPIQPGISIGYAECGTLGLICKDKDTGSSCLLTSYHVLQGSPGLPVTQPGLGADGGTMAQTIAVYSKGILDNFSDAAVARLIGIRQLLFTQYGTNDILTSVRQVNIGDNVCKSGRSTAVTNGLVDGIGKYMINYAGIGLREIEGFRVAPTIASPGQPLIGNQGDSGAVWYDPQTKAALGLNTAGSGNSAFNFVVACHLPKVFSSLNLSL